MEFYMYFSGLTVGVVVGCVIGFGFGLKHKKSQSDK
jgi:MFS superfamily sulfate permease-like transporter